MTYEDNCLAHFGILGQKWGVRRFQNEDGTLTEEGKKRYAERERDIEYAKDYAKKQIPKEERQLSFWKSQSEKTRNTPATKKAIMKMYNISESDYDDYIREFKTPERILKDDLAYNKRHERIYINRIKDWNKKIKQLEKLKVDVTVSNGKHQKEIENIFSNANGWLFRTIELYDLRSAIKTGRKQYNEKSK